VDLIVWSKILIFVFPSYGGSRIQSIIERKWNFGSIGRVRTYSGSPEESEQEFHSKFDEIVKSETEKEKKNTFELASLLFKDQFSKENLQKYLEELDKLTYQKDSEEEYKRLSLLNIFSEMLGFLNQYEKSVNG